MREALEIVNGLPLPIQAAWAAWLAWGAVQIVWYRRARAPIVQRPPSPRPRPRRPTKPIEPAAVEVPPPADVTEPAVDSRVA